MAWYGEPYAKELASSLPLAQSLGGGLLVRVQEQPADQDAAKALFPSLPSDLVCRQAGDDLAEAKRILEP